MVKWEFNQKHNAFCLQANALSTSDFTWSLVLDNLILMSIERRSIRWGLGFHGDLEGFLLTLLDCMRLLHTGPYQVQVWEDKRVKMVGLQIMTRIIWRIFVHLCVCLKHHVESFWRILKGERT